MPTRNIRESPSRQTTTVDLVPKSIAHTPWFVIAIEKIGFERVDDEHLDKASFLLGSQVVGNFVPQLIAHHAFVSHIPERLGYF